MTDIHFCDLCNESVPDVDLKGGRAFLVKGRVVCATCNRAMSVTDGVEGAPPGPVSKPASYSAPHASARPRGNLFAVAIGTLALCLTAALGYWTYHQLESREVRASDRISSLQGQHDRLVQDFGHERQALLGQIAELEQRLAGADQEQRQAFDQRLAEHARTADVIGTAVSRLEPKFATLDAAITRLDGQDEHIAVVEQRFAELARDLNVLQGEMSKEIAAIRAAPADEPVAVGESVPAWHGLLADLSNESVSVRWQAITALGETHDPAIAPHVVPALHDPDIFIRVAAARVLGDVGNPVAVDSLIDALADDVGTVRDAAYLALKAITKRDLPFDPETEDENERNRRIKAWREWWEKERSKLGA
jgi:hypothetical protein